MRFVDPLCDMPVYSKISNSSTCFFSTLFYISESSIGADQVELAALEFQRRFHISTDDADVNQRNSVSLSQGSDSVDSPSSSRRESSTVSSMPICFNLCLVNDNIFTPPLYFRLHLLPQRMIP